MDNEIRNDETTEEGMDMNTSEESAESSDAE